MNGNAPNRTRSRLRRWLKQNRLHAGSASSRLRKNRWPALQTKHKAHRYRDKWRTESSEAVPMRKYFYLRCSHFAGTF